MSYKKLDNDETDDLDDDQTTTTSYTLVPTLNSKRSNDTQCHGFRLTSHPSTDLTIPDDLPTSTVDITEEGGLMSFMKRHTYTPSSSQLKHKYGFRPLERYTSTPSNVTLILAKRRGKHAMKPHTPVAATTVFARGAPRLHLPKLDNYLASLERPEFLDDESHCRKDTMFPPMDKLVSMKRSLDDLEHNKQIPPFWRNRTGLFGTATNLVLGITGSSALAAFYSLQGLANTLQIFALILTTIFPFDDKLSDNWHQLFLGRIPNVLAFNFASSVTQSLILLAIFLTLSSALLYYFHRSTGDCDRYGRVEGLQQNVPEGKRWGVLIVTFALTVMYLPLSTMAVHVLVWSDDLWVVENPYKNATTLPPTPPALGPVSEYRDPLDFCWTTTMKKNEINFAPVIIFLSVLVSLSLTLWFPFALRLVIRQSIPKVEMYTSLGRKRSRVELDNEYHRLVERDQNPFTFLYSNYRRGWATYQSTYLFAKLSSLLVIALINPDNCLFRSLPRTPVSIVRQALLLVSTIGFFLAQCFFVPFQDPVNNASEWTSRLNYVATSIVALLLALHIPGQQIYNLYLVYIIYIVTYGLSVYFTVINLGPVRRTIKRWTKRIDFSIDIFSPSLDLAFPSVHTKHRIWQESISTLLLTNQECMIPVQQKMSFAQARESEFPPYLLDFRGTPAERHVENLRILRDVGSHMYNKITAQLYGPDKQRIHELETEIQMKYIGPDSYWRDDKGTDVRRSNHFGNAWWIPFPPTLVLRYDDGGSYAIISNISELERYLAQNKALDVCRKRQIRMSLRALEGQTVRWPYDHVTPVGHASLFSWGNSSTTRTSFHYDACQLKIVRKGHLQWDGFEFGSGFNIVLSYSKKLELDGGAIGLTDDFELTPPLAHFLGLNRQLIHALIGNFEGALTSYRRHHLQECRLKTDVLTYRFTAHVFDHPQDSRMLTASSIEMEKDPRVRDLMSGSEEVFSAAYARFCAASRSETTAWWYIFWDDLWRRNHDTVPGLELHAADFNPWYPTSIAYTPVPRPVLESLLIQRGLMSNKGRRGTDFLHSGFLNKLYLRLNETVFRGSSRAIMFHVGDAQEELDMEDIDMEDLVQPSTMGTLGTGGGTDHDDTSILARPTYKWEGLLSDSLQTGKIRRRRKFLSKLGAWMGVTPLWREGEISHGLSLDVKLENGRYVLTDDGGTEGGDSYMVETHKPSE